VVPNNFKQQIFSKTIGGKFKTNICLYPFDALLKQGRDLTLPQAVHQFLGRVMRRQKFHAIDEPVKFLK
jgi:hypothetical protein